VGEEDKREEEERKDLRTLAETLSHREKMRRG